VVVIEVAARAGREHSINKLLDAASLDQSR
jgi:hypothetical protein